MNYNLKVGGISLKEFLQSYNVGKTTIYKWFSQKLIKVNENVVKDDYILAVGDNLQLPDEGLATKPYKHTIDVIYEDNYLLIINKPYGFIIHSDEDNLACDNMVANYYIEKGLNLKVRHIHRLDKETTGILIYAKDYLTECYFNYHLERHDFKRYYLALVEGKMNKSLTIEKPIGRDRHNSNHYLVTKNGKYAKTYVKPLKYAKRITLVEVLLETGRTHQIRVHLKSCGYPLVNDPLYNPGQGLMALESKSFSFIHPYTLETMTINCPLNKEFDILNEK